jgi:hypothetical protein
MSQWLCRDRWPVDPFGCVYLLRAVDMVGARKFGEQWQPPAKLTEETATDVAAYDRGWITSEEFLTVSRLVAERCATSELEAIRLEGAQVIAMDADEWLLEHSREGDACFRTGHVFLPNKVLPVFLRRGSLEKFIAGLIPTAPAPVGQPGPPEQYDWDEGFQFMRQELDKRGDPKDPLNERPKGWRADADVARAVAAHIAIDGQEPDFKHTGRVIRPKLKAWRAEQVERN